MIDIVEIFKALGDETRLNILIILSRRRICGKGIARHLGLSEAAISQHLKVLREAELIYGEKDGYYVHYELKKDTFQYIEEFTNYITNNKEQGCCSLKVNIPEDCNIKCKANKNKCCKRHEEV